MRQVPQHSLEVTLQEVQAESSRLFFLFKHRSRSMDKLRFITEYRETRHEFEERGVHRRAGVSHVIPRRCGGFLCSKRDLLPAVCYLPEQPATCYLQIRKSANDASGARALCARLQYSDNRPCLNVVMHRAWPEPICNGSRPYPAPCRQQAARTIQYLEH